MPPELFQRALDVASGGGWWRRLPVLVFWRPWTRNAPKTTDPAKPVKRFGKIFTGFRKIVRNALI
jgi:hypothetical protein